MISVVLDDVTAGLALFSRFVVFVGYIQPLIIKHFKRNERFRLPTTLDT